MGWMGLDIGGANIKVCLSETDAFSVEFPLWQQPQRLGAELEVIFRRVPEDFGVAVTMTGELADCFSTRSEGVEFIVSEVVSQAAARQTLFYTADGQWVDSETALDNWIGVAASNWHAIASYCSRFLDQGNGFLFDIGSTTADIIPIRNGHPAAAGKTDYSRLVSGELCYAGVHRTPLCSVLSGLQIEGNSIGIAREVFATMLDAFIVLGEIGEAEQDCRTADGRPASFECATQRLSRMVCNDAALLSHESLVGLASQASDALTTVISSSLTRVAAANSDLPLEFICCGQGAWFAKKVVESVFESADVNIVELAELRGSGVSCAAAAYSVSRLASESVHELSSISSGLNRTIANAPVRVIKIGGSVLKWEGAQEQISNWLAKQSEMVNVWIVGGGEIANFVRKWNLQSPLETTDAHWICIDVMSITVRLLKAWFPHWQFSDQFESLAAAEAPANILFDTSNWLRTTSGLPESWQVTSDSCAGFLAQEIDSEELVLLKSCDIPEAGDLDVLSKAGIIDESFSHFANGVPLVRIVNVCDPLFAESAFDSDQQRSNRQISSG